MLWREVIILWNRPDWFSCIICRTELVYTVHISNILGTETQSVLQVFETELLTRSKQEELQLTPCSCMCFGKMKLRSLVATQGSTVEAR